MLLLDGELFELEVRADGVELRERMTTPDQSRHVGVVIIEFTQHVEDECVVADQLTMIGQLICHSLESLAILQGGEVSLREGPKLSIKVHGPSRPIVEELLFDGKPRKARDGRAIVAGQHKLDEVSGDCSIEPREDRGVHASMEKSSSERT